MITTRTLLQKTRTFFDTHSFRTLAQNRIFPDRAVISVESVLGSFRIAVLRLCHDLLRLALHARDRLERPRRVALGRHLDVDYGAVRVSGG